MKSKIFLAFFLLFISNLSFSDNKKELIVYSSRKEHLIKDIFKKYEAKSGIKISYKIADANVLIQNLKIEGSKTPADIFMTVDAGNLWYASSQNLFQSIDSEILKKNVAKHLRDPENLWFGLSLRARTIVYNPSLVKETQLKSYEDLADPKWKNKICLRTSRKVYNQSLVAMLIDQNGYAKTKKIIKGWVDNTVEIFSNDTAVLKAIAKKKCALGIVNTYYFGRLIKKQKDLNLKLFWPNQKNYGTHINISGAGVLKDSDNKKEAQKFLEWLSSKEAQDEFAKVNKEYPVNKDVKASKEVLSWGDFKPNTTFPLYKAGVLQKDALKLMLSVGYK